MEPVDLVYELRIMNMEKRKRILFGSVAKKGCTEVGFSFYRVPSGVYLFINLIWWQLIIRSA